MSACLVGCPGCKATLGPGRPATIEQCGNTTIPALRHECEGCPREAIVTLPTRRPLATEPAAGPNTGKE